MDFKIHFNKSEISYRFLLYTSRLILLILINLGFSLVEGKHDYFFHYIFWNYPLFDVYF